MMTFPFAAISRSSAVSSARLLPVAALGLAGLLAGCKSAAPAADEPAAVTVQAEKAEAKDITSYVEGDTFLSPLAQSALVPKISAPIKKFYVQRGSHVRQGQLLATLENGDLSAAVTDLRGSLDQAQATFDTTTKAVIPEDKQKAQLDVAQAKANLSLAKNVADARKGLLDQGAIPRRDYETAQASYVQAKGAYDIAEQHLKSLNSVSNQASIASAQGALLSAKGKYQAAAAGLGYSELRSPISGYVTDRPLFPGEMAQAGAPVITVMDTSSLIAKVHLAQDEAADIKVGDPADVKVTGIDDPVKGKVSLVSPALDTGSTTVEVWVKIPNAKNDLKAGTPAHVQIAAQTLPQVLSVPNEAVVKNKEGAPAVMVVQGDGTAKSFSVKTGITDGKDTQILSGVKAGDEVITKGAFGMDDGTKVKVVAAGAADDDEKPSAGKTDEKTPADEKAPADEKPADKGAAKPAAKEEK